MNKKFWKDIVYTNGKFDEKKVFNELLDYSFLLNEVPKVYCEITGGLLSKPNYKAEVILAKFEEKFWDKEIIKSDIVDILKSKDNNKQKLKEIKNYLEIYE